MYKDKNDKVDSFIKEKKKERLLRQENRVKNDAVIIIQKNIRRFLVQSKLRKDFRKKFLDIINETDSQLSQNLYIIKVFDNMQFLRFLFSKRKQDIEIFCLLCKKFSSSMTSACSFGYDSVFMDKEKAKNWLFISKWIIETIIVSLFKLNDKNDHNLKNITMLTTFLLQLTSPNHWFHLKDDRLFDRFEKISKIFIDHAINKGLFKANKDLLWRIINQNNTKFTEIIINNCFSVSIKPLIFYKEKSNYYLNFTECILTIPGIVMNLNSTNVESMKKNLVLNQLVDHLNDSNPRNVHLKGHEFLYIIANIVHLSLNEIELLIERSMKFCRLISEFLRILGKYVSERKNTNQTTWHPILGWFSQTDEQCSAKNMENVLKQIRLLWHNKMVLLLFSNLYEEKDLGDEEKMKNFGFSGIDTPLPGYVKFENLPTFSRLKKDSTSVFSSFMGQIGKKILSQKNVTECKIMPKDLPETLKTVSMMYCFLISSLSEIRNDLLNGLSLGDLLLRMWRLIYACGSIDQWANSIHQCDSKWFKEPNECHFYFLFTSATSNLLIILDDTELFEKQKSFHVDQLQAMVTLFNNLFYRTVLITPNPSELRVMSSNFVIFSNLTLDNEEQNTNPKSSTDKRSKPADNSSFSGSYSLNLLLSSTLTILQILYARDIRYPFTDSPKFWEIQDIKSLAFMSDLRKDRPHAKFLLKHVPHILSHRERIILFRDFVKADKISIGRKVISSYLPDDGPYGTMISVNRNTIIEDGYQQLRNLTPLQLKMKIRVQFTNKMGLDEVGIDLDGVFKEFLEETLRKVFDPGFSLFKTTTDNRLYPSPTSNLQNGHLKLFEFFGKVLGKAIYEGITIDVPLANFFLTQMLHKEKTGCYSFLDELATLDKDLYKSLTYVKHYEGDVTDLSLTFSYDENVVGAIVVHDLVPGGRYITVTSESKISYVHRLAHFRMYKQIRAQTVHFMQGFYSIIKPEWLSIFSSLELQKLISGDSVSIDIDDLKNNTKYMGGFHGNHRVILWLWDILKKDFDEKERGLFLKFVTSCSKPPLLGFSHLEPQFCIRCVQYTNEDSDTGDTIGSVILGFLHLPFIGSGNSSSTSSNSRSGNSSSRLGNIISHSNDTSQLRLPSASTCFNLLKLPKYNSKKILRDKLRYAIHSNAGFELS